MLILRGEKARERERDTADLQLRTNITTDVQRSSRELGPLHPAVSAGIVKIMKRDRGEDLNPDRRFIGGAFACFILPPEEDFYVNKQTFAEPVV